jgi:hypothetical protein
MNGEQKIIVCFLKRKKKPMYTQKKKKEAADEETNKKITHTKKIKTNILKERENGERFFLYSRRTKLIVFVNFFL